MKTMIRPPIAGVLIAGLAWFLVGTCKGAEDPGTARLVIGLAQPPNLPGQAGAGTDLPDPLRQALVRDLQDSGIAVVTLSGGTQDQIDQDARSRNCQYVLYTRVQQKHGMGAGLFGKLAPLASALPFAGLRGGGGVTGLAAQAAANQVANSAANQMAASAAQAQQPAGSAQTAIRRGDSLVLEYRLMTTGSTAAIKSDTLNAKADADGQDVLTPLAGQLANSVKNATGTGEKTGGGGQLATGPGTAAPPTTATTPQAATALPTTTDGGNATPERRGFLSGLLSHRASASPAASPSMSPSAAPDCSRIANMPNAPVSFEMCQKMASANQAYTQALADPRAAKPGDELMSCQQISAELRQQQISAPDHAQTAQLQKAAADEQSMLKRHIAEQAKIQAEVQATVDAGAAVDTATEVATMGMVRPNTASAAAMAGQARARAVGERQAAERRPTEQKMMGGVADVAQDAAAQLSANPRLGRLMQLAEASHCKQL